MSSTKSRILIVDDEPAVLSGLQLAFEEGDWMIDVATSGLTALDHVKAGKQYDLIITDKNLPDIDGVDLIRRIRANDSKTLFVMITGYASLKSAVDTANLGIHAYIEKPFRDVFEVRQQVANLLGARRKPNRVAQLLAAHASPLSLLVATADSRARKQIAEHLEGRADVITCSSSKDLLESLATRAPSAVLLHNAFDLLELCLGIRDQNQSMPLIVVSELDLATTKQLISIGVTAIINQPTESKEFAKRLIDVLKAADQSRRRTA